MNYEIKAAAFHRHRYLLPLFVAGWTLTSFPAYGAGGDLESKTLPLYFNSEVMFAAHRSDAISGTDFGTEYGSTLGVWGGKRKNFGLSLSTRSIQTNFAQDDAKTASSWTDMDINYRFLWFYPHLALGFCTMKLESVGTKVMDANCRTFGGGLELKVPAGSSVVVSLDMDFYKISGFRDKIDNSNAIKQRSEYAFTVDVYPMSATWMSIVGGFRYRTYNLTIATEDHKEMETGPFVGFNLGLDF